MQRLNIREACEHFAEKPDEPIVYVSTTGEEWPCTDQYEFLYIVKAEEE